MKGRLVFAMRVTEVASFDEYWLDPRFNHKRPNLRGSRKQWFGDNIYHRNPESGYWIQENSHHSRNTGRPLKANVVHDTQADRVLISNDFVYFGGDAIRIPTTFRKTGSTLWKNGAGHKCNFPEPYVNRVVEWLRSLSSWGYAGNPKEFAGMEWA